MLGFACAVFHWTPEEFWKSSPCELYAAIDGYREINCVDNTESEAEFSEFRKSLENAGVN